MFDFNDSLNVIEKNLDEAIGAYFVYDNIMQKAVVDKSFLIKLNQNSYFWHYILYSLQTTYFMSLGRIFDQRRGTLSINVFLNKCTENINLFSKVELKKRKAEHITDNDELQKYINNAYEPGSETFKDLKRIVKEYSKEYEKNYRDIRHLVFAHTKITKKKELEQLFSNTSRNKLEEIFIRLKYVMIGLFGLYHNGHKIELSKNIKPDELSILRKIKEESNSALKLL